MMRFLLASLVLAAGGCASFKSPLEGARLSTDALSRFPAGDFVIGPDAAQIEFAVSPLGVGRVEGAFKTFDASLTLADPKTGTAEIVALVDTTSVHLSNDQYKDMVEGPGWFDIAQFPSARFEGKMMGWSDDGSGEFRGTMTIRGVSQDETMTLRLTCDDIPSCPEKAVGFAGDLRVSRAAYGMNRLSGIVRDEVQLVVTGTLTAP